jgi:hypothetical protein
LWALEEDIRYLWDTQKDTEHEEGLYEEGKDIRMSSAAHEYDEALLKAAPEIDKKQRQVSLCSFVLRGCFHFVSC